MLALGVDCGTSKVAIALVDQSGTPVQSASLAHQAQLPAPPGRFEQDATRILSAATQLVRALPSDLRMGIEAIGVTGQMHGAVLHDAALRALGPLVTWQDRRVLEDATFLPSLLHPRTLHAGYGVATLHWWARHGQLGGSPRASTIHGFLAATWCGADRAAIDPTDDQAWGGLEGISGLPSDLLPRRVNHGDPIGALSAAAADTLGLRAGIPLAAPLGDNQASLRATLVNPLAELAFTLGTGCQLAAVVRRGALGELGMSDLRPYDHDHDVLVAAPLCGGAAWLWLADQAIAWATDLGLPPPPRDQVLARLDALGLAAEDRLVMQPHLAGERHDPALTGSITGLALSNGRLGEWARALARGIPACARAMMPPSAWHGRQRVMASGNALRRSSLLRLMSEAELGLPLIVREPCEEAATGAGLVALSLVAGGPHGLRQRPELRTAG
jgi:sugar (pentulose or hexulose) kinase